MGSKRKKQDISTLHHVLHHA